MSCAIGIPGDNQVYFAGAASNFALQPSEQNKYVFPLRIEVPAGRAGSTVMPQTGSMKVGCSTAVMYFAGAASNFDLQPSEQKEYVFPL